MTTKALPPPAALARLTWTPDYPDAPVKPALYEEICKYREEKETVSHEPRTLVMLGAGAPGPAIKDHLKDLFADVFRQYIIGVAEALNPLHLNPPTTYYIHDVEAMSSDWHKATADLTQVWAVLSAGEVQSAEGYVVTGRPSRRSEGGAAQTRAHKHPWISKQSAKP